jgi:hypothetical protein
MDGKNKDSSDSSWSYSERELEKVRSINWTRKRFVAVDGFWTTKDGLRMLSKVSDDKQPPPDAILDKRAWDHEHCTLCFAKISEYDADINVAYSDTDKEWLCPDCYDTYVVVR